MDEASGSRRLPSPSIIVAIVALIAALTGSAIALPGKGSVDKSDLAKGSVTKKAIKKGAVTTKAIKNGAVTDATIKDGAVSAAKLADDAVTTAKVADNAVTDAKIDGVVPAAFALVSDGTDIVPAQSEGVGSAVTSGENSFVCFNGLPFTPRNIEVTVARGGGSSEQAFPNAFLPADNTFCAGNEQASVQFLDENGTPTNAPAFYITFFD